VIEDGLTAGDVARRLGVAVTTLRTWHQRYGLGPSRHVTGHHRRYTEDDVARLDVMRRLTGLGVPAAEAARVALAQAIDQPAGPTVRDGGGHAIPVGRAGPPARGLARAAMRLDAPTMVAVIAAAVREQGVVRTWDRLLCPVLIGIGERHAVTKRLVEVEHLLSRSISEVLAAVPRPVDGRRPRALLACANEEQHSLPLEALAAALAEHGCGSRLLGARVPQPALAEAVRRTGPAAVVVWSHAAATAEPEQLRALLAARPRPLMIAAAGPGWVADQVPSGIEQPTDLTEALGLTLGVAGPDAC
jgi:DNA-binding transcriptional MerR regulator